MYQMNDKVFLTKISEAYEKKGFGETKREIKHFLCNISDLFTFNMFFVYVDISTSGRGWNCARNAFIYLHPDVIKNDHHKWAQN